jgi:hypothetical protein
MPALRPATKASRSHFYGPGTLNLSGEAARCLAAASHPAPPTPGPACESFIVRPAWAQGAPAAAQS